MAKNITSLQLLRNTSQLYATRDAAYAALTGTTAPPSGTTDGTPVLARYKGTDNKIYTLVGYYATAEAFAGSVSGETYMTVFDFEGQAGDVEKLREEINAKLGDGVTSANTATAQFTALSGNSSSSSAETSVEGAKRYADEKVNALDYNLAKNDNMVVVSFEQENGKITGTSENITAVKLAGLEATADTKIAAADTLGTALAKLQGQIDSMDKAASVVAGQVVTTVTETDGKVTETKANVKDLQLGGYSKDAAASGAIGSTDTVNVALSKLENNATANKITNADGSINVTTATTGTDINVNIKSTEKVIKKDGNSGIYTDLDLVKITTGLPSTVKERYQLLASDDSQIGANIDIYKDSALYNVYLGHVDDTITSPTNPTVVPGSGDTALCFIYLKSDGTYQLVAVNVEEFIEENEFASGVTWDATAKKVRGVVDPTSEKVVLTYTTGGTSATTGTVLTVDANGFKVSNIQAAIDAKVNSAISLLDATVSGGTTAATETASHVKVVVGEADGKLTAVTVTETNVADKTKLEELSGKTFTVATSSNASISTAVTAASDGTKSVDLITDASKIQMSGFTSTSVLSGITQGSAVTEAFSEVERVIEENEETVAAALTDLDTRLKDEITARKAVDGQTGQTYAHHADKKYISGATSLDDADVMLNDAIANITSGWIEGVQVNGKDLPESGNKVNVQITAQETPTANASGIHVATSDAGAITLSLGVINAGEY